MDAVNGFSRVNEADAIPVFVTSMGNVNDAWEMSVLCRAGMVTGLRRMASRAAFRESIGVDDVVPAISVLESTP